MQPCTFHRPPERYREEMPRWGNTRSPDPRHHSAMHSPAHGKGADAKARKVKYDAGADARKKKRKKKRAVHAQVAPVPWS